MNYTLILIVLLIILAGVIAYAGDRLGTFIGKKRLSLFGMRPKRSGQIIGVAVGVFIMLTTLGVSALAFQEAAAVVLRAQESAKHLRALKKEKEQLHLEKEQLQTEVATLQQNTLDLQQDIVIFHQELQQTRQSLRAVVNERDNNEKKLKEVNIQLISAQNNLHTVEEELQDARAERKKAVEAAQTAQQEMTSLQSQVSEAENRLKDAAKELATLQVQLRASQNALQNSQAQLDQVEIDLAATQNEFELQQRLIADLKFKGQNTRNNLLILQWQAQELQERILNLSIQAAELRQQNNSLTVANEILGRDNHSLAIANQALESENVNLQTNIQELSQNSSDFQEQIMVLRKELQQSNVKLREARAEIQTISKRALSFKKDELIYSGVISAKESDIAKKQFSQIIETANNLSLKRGAGKIIIPAEEINKLIGQLVQSVDKDIITFTASENHIGPAPLKVTLTISKNRKILNAGQLISSHQFFIVENSPRETIRNEVNHLNNKTSKNLRSMGMFVTTIPTDQEINIFSDLLSGLKGAVVIGTVAEDEIYVGEEASLQLVVLQ